MDQVFVKINGVPRIFKSRHELARFLMTHIKDPISPLDSRLENLYKIMDLTGFDKKAKYVDRINDEKQYEVAYWDLLLSLEHLGILPGFSVNASIEKGRSGYNPEKVRVSTDWNLYDNIK